MPRTSSPAYAVVIALLLTTTAWADQGSPTFKLHVESDGVYRVDFEELVAALPQPMDISQGLPSGKLGLFHHGEPVPIWVHDGGDGLFAAGDSLEMIGSHLPGEVSFASENSRFNVYVLRTDVSEPARMESLSLAEGGPGQAPQRLRSVQHLEQDRTILRLPIKRDQPVQELWYWKKLVHMHRKPEVHTLDLSNLSQAPGATVDIRIGLRGWSNVRKKGRSRA